MGGMKEEPRLLIAQITARLGIAGSTWRAYVARGHAPQADGRFSPRQPWWWESTITDYERKHPRAAARKSRPRTSSGRALTQPAPNNSTEHEETDAEVSG